MKEVKVYDNWIEYIKEFPYWKKGIWNREAIHERYWYCKTGCKSYVEEVSIKDVIEGLNIEFENGNYCHVIESENIDECFVKNIGYENTIYILYIDKKFEGFLFNKREVDYIFKPFKANILKRSDFEEEKEVKNEKK